MKKLVLLMIPILIWGASCDKETKAKEEEMADNNKAYHLTPPEPGDVYVAGTVEGKAVLWKNGFLQNLTDETEHFFPQSVYISGNDIYMAGYGSGAKLWKNGVVQKLDGHIAYSVFVSGGDVYVVGEKVVRESYGFGGRGMPAIITAAILWKNGSEQYLTDGTNTAYAASVFVSGEDVYVAGSHNSPTVWKNGFEQKLSDAPFHGRVTSIYVSGKDVYVTGDFQHSVQQEAKQIAMLWKNGVEQKLTDETNNAFASSVFVSGYDVYVSGYEYIAGKQVATIWKNGVAQRLADGANNTYAHSIYVSGKDVYVAGYEHIRSISGEEIIADEEVATVWKNGVAHKLAEGNYSTRASSVFVVE